MNIIETAWKWNGSLSKRNSTDYIALHHAAAKSCTGQQIDNWHKGNGWSGIGYHFFVRKDGTIYRGRPIWSVGAHVSGMNNCSIGICAEGNYDIETSMPQPQYESIYELIQYLKSVYPNAKIVGHREIGASDCPGKYYPLDKLKNTEQEGLTMSEYSELSNRIAKLENKMIYDYIDNNMPSWARPTIQKMINKGLLGGDENGKLGLTDEMLRIFVINDRAGLYD